MKLITFLFSIIILCSCYKSISISNCKTRKQIVAEKKKIVYADSSLESCFTQSELSKIKELLKSQKIPVDKFIIRKASNVKSLDSCITLYHIFTNDWKEYKKITNYGVSIPMLKFEDKITLNAYYFKNESRLSDTIKVKEDLSEFIGRYNKFFSENQIEEISSSYSYGIDILLKGYFR